MTRPRPQELRRHRDPHALRGVGLACVLVAVLAVPSGGCRRRNAQETDPDAAAQTPGPVNIVYPSAPRSFVNIASKATAALVHIYADTPVRGGPAELLPPSPESAGPPADAELMERLQRALGSGFIVGSRGQVLTNAHLLGKKTKVWVELADGTRLPALVAGHDERTDLALLKVNPAPGKRLSSARLGDSEQLELGEWVVALGNPFGLGPRLTAGVVSALARIPRATGAPHYLNFIQTDARIDATNSGGPLLNTVGEVVGMNTAIGSGDAHGAGLALPIDTIKRLVPILERQGGLSRSWIGMYIDRVTDERARTAGLGKARGALVTSVWANGPAERAGLREGDIVVAFDGRPVTEAAQLPWLALEAGVARPIGVKVWREGKEISFTLRAEHMPQ